MASPWRWWIQDRKLLTEAPTCNEEVEDDGDPQGPRALGMGISWIPWEFFMNIMGNEFAMNF